MGCGCKKSGNRVNPRPTIKKTPNKGGDSSNNSNRRVVITRRRGG